MRFAFLRSSSPRREVAVQIDDGVRRESMLFPPEYPVWRVLQRIYELYVDGRGENKEAPLAGGDRRRLDKIADALLVIEVDGQVVVSQDMAREMRSWCAVDGSLSPTPRSGLEVGRVEEIMSRRRAPRYPSSRSTPRRRRSRFSRMA